MIRFFRRRSTSLLMTAALLLATGCTSRFGVYREAGAVLMEEGRFAAARGQFLAAHDMVPENADNLCDLGRCQLAIAREYELRGDRRGSVRELNSAVHYYRRAVQSFPGYQKALDGLNEALETRGMFDEALASAEWATRMVGPSARQQLVLAREYDERGDADNALLAYRQAVAMEPKNPTPYWALGLYFIKLNRHEEAIKQLQQAYRLDPKQAFIAEKLQTLGGEVPVVRTPTQPG